MKFAFLFLFVFIVAIMYAQNSDLHKNKTLSTCFDDTLFNELPIFDVNSELKLFPNTFTFDNNRLLYNNMQPVEQSVFLDGIPISMFSDFPFFVINKIECTKNSTQLSSGNSLGGNFNFYTIIPSDSLSATINIRKDFPYVNFKNNGHDAGQNAIEGMLEINGTLKLSEKFKPKFLIAWSIKNDAEPFPTNQLKTNMNDNKIAELYSDPLSVAGFGVNSNAEFATGDIFTKSRFIKNDDINYNKFYGKIILPINKNIQITIGNYSTFKNGKLPIYENLLMNWWNNPSFKENYSLSYLKYEHDLIKTDKLNIKYNINASFSHYYNVVENNDYKKDFFRYGYAGNFKTDSKKTYNWTDTINGYSSGVWQQTGSVDNHYTFTSNEYSNPFYSTWNTDYYNTVNHNDVYFLNAPLYQAGGGLLNGDEPKQVYNLWNNSGTPYNSYSQNEENNWYISGNFNIKYKKVDINIGGDFSKKISRSYSITPNKFWTLARTLTNNQIQELDYSNPHPVYDANGVFQDTINYDRLYNPNLQTYFDLMLRNYMGIPKNSTKWIETDNYNPSDFSIDMFSANEIMSANILQTNGYDYTGKKITNYSYSDFFTSKNIYGADYRPIKAFEPISYNVFINAKYNYKNFDIEAGIKLNAYNSNQPVLDDPYSFYKIHKAGDITSINGVAVSHPSNIGSNYAVYVDNFNNPTRIMGYRNGNTWYDFLGNLISNNAYMSQPYVVPYLVNADIYSPTFYSDNFISYKTVYNILPFIQLNYNFRKYLVYCSFYSNSQNPGYESVFNPINYGYFSNSTFLASNYRGIFTNSALKPMNSNNIEGGIYNYLGKKAKVGLYYKYNETGNIIDIKKYINGFPFEYWAYYNTPNILVTHGLTFVTDISQIFKSGFGFGGSVCMQEHVSNSGVYNLYFPNVIAKSWLTYTVDNGTHGNTNFYKYFSKHFTLSLLFNYRQMSTFTEYLSSYYNKDETMPAEKNNYNLNVSVQKSFYTFNNQYIITAYCMVENILNTQNLLFYYSKTGNANDDGYLTDSQNQAQINSQNSPEAYRNYYRMYANNPSNYDIPRILRVGLKIGF